LLCLLRGWVQVEVVGVVVSCYVAPSFLLANKIKCLEIEELGPVEKNSIYAYSRQLLNLASWSLFLRYSGEGP
jgi:hypothetical protein